MTSAPSCKVQTHLQEIGRTVAPDAHAVLLLDRAGWHTQPWKAELPVDFIAPERNRRHDGGGYPAASPWPCNASD